MKHNKILFIVMYNIFVPGIIMPAQIHPQISGLKDLESAIQAARIANRLTDIERRIQPLEQQNPTLANRSKWGRLKTEENALRYEQRVLSEQTRPTDNNHGCCIIA